MDAHGCDGCALALVRNLVRLLTHVPRGGCRSLRIVQAMVVEGRWLSWPAARDRPLAFGACDPTPLGTHIIAHTPVVKLVAAPQLPCATVALIGCSCHASGYGTSWPPCPGSASCLRPAALDALNVPSYRAFSYVLMPPP
eukprot:364882-Chlamydomonas_euryale.AAC.3